MRDFLDAIGLVLVLEGLFYAAFPALAKRLASDVIRMAPHILRWGGVTVAAVGVVIIWLVRG